MFTCFGICALSSAVLREKKCLQSETGLSSLFKPVTQVPEQRITGDFTVALTCVLHKSGSCPASRHFRETCEWLGSGVRATNSLAIQLYTGVGQEPHRDFARLQSPHAALVSSPWHCKVPGVLVASAWCEGGMV